MKKVVKWLFLAPLGDTLLKAIICSCWNVTCWSFWSYVPSWNNLVAAILTLGFALTFWWLYLGVVIDAARIRRLTRKG